LHCYLTITLIFLEIDAAVHYRLWVTLFCSEAEGVNYEDEIIAIGNVAYVFRSA